LNSGIIWHFTTFIGFLDSIILTCIITILFASNIVPFTVLLNFNAVAVVIRSAWLSLLPILVAKILFILPNKFYFTGKTKPVPFSFELSQKRLVLLFIKDRYKITSSSDAISSGFRLTQAILMDTIPVKSKIVTLIFFSAVTLILVFTISLIFVFVIDLIYFLVVTFV